MGAGILASVSVKMSGNQRRHRQTTLISQWGTHRGASLTFFPPHRFTGVTISVCEGTYFVAQLLAICFK